MRISRADRFQIKECRMDKEEFLQSLRRDLSGDVPQNVLEENVKYYREYIDGEIAKGRSEEEVIAELGTPRLIAKNIEDTTEMDEEEAGGGRFTDRGYGDTYSGGAGGGFDDRYENPGSFPGQDGRRGGFHLFDLSKWYGKLAVLLIVFVVIYVVFAIVGGVFSLLAPFLGPILVIWLIVALIRGSGRR